MPLQIVRNDITKMPVDAIVNAANTSLLGGGGVDGAIHRAAGPELLAECRALGGCPTGEAKLTRGFRLPARYIIHTVGPVWQGGGRGEEALLRSCYRKSLEIAAAHNCETVAFPLISAGAYGYPREEALQVAVGEIGRFLMDHDLTVYLVVFDRDSFRVSRKLISDITEYIDEHYAATHVQVRRSAPPCRPGVEREETASVPICAPAPASAMADEAQMFSIPLDFPVDESFSQMLLRKIDESGMTDAQCYKKANIDRKLFNKIKNDPHYKPSKPTAVAFAIALELDLKDARELLDKAGFSLSHSFKFDLIIEYFIQQGNYDIFQINEALFEFDQVLLGG